MAARTHRPVAPAPGPPHRTSRWGGAALGHVSASSGTDDAHSKATTAAQSRLCVSPAVPSELAGIPPCSRHLGKLIGMRAALGDVIPGTALNPLTPRFLVIFLPKSEVVGPRQRLHSGRQEITYVLPPPEAHSLGVGVRTAPCSRGLCNPAREALLVPPESQEARAQEGSRTPAARKPHAVGPKARWQSPVTTSSQGTSSSHFLPSLLVTSTVVLSRTKYPPGTEIILECVASIPCPMRTF